MSYNIHRNGTNTKIFVLIFNIFFLISNLFLQIKLFGKHLREKLIKFTNNLHITLEKVPYSCFNVAQIIRWLYFTQGLSHASQPYRTQLSKPLPRCIRYSFLTVLELIIGQRFTTYIQSFLLLKLEVFRNLTDISTWDAQDEYFSKNV